MKAWGRELIYGVVAIRSKAGQLGDGFDAASRSATANEHDEIDRFRDEAPRHGDDGLLYELLQPINRRTRGVRVDRRKPAGMPGVPCLQHVERFRAADLADDDAIWA